MTLSLTAPSNVAQGAPRAPQNIPETRLSPTFLLDLLIKVLATHRLERPSQMAAALRLSAGVVDQLIDIARDRKLLLPMGQSDASLLAEMRYQLSAAGRAWAARARERCRWTGPAPVEITEFCDQVRHQSIRNERLTEHDLRRTVDTLTLPEDVLDKIGPALNSAASLLLHGPPGNGKSSIARAVCDAFSSTIFIPHAIAVGNEVVVLFDPVVHQPVQTSVDAPANPLRRTAGFDNRYIPCLRPHVIVGGEFTVDKLDIARSPSTGLYDAPMHLKALGGIFVLDDFGRQRNVPQEFVNRLIVPLENGVEYLQLEGGLKIEVPFDTLVIFATNYEPRSLMDEAGLRRLRHKILVDRPDTKRFLKILVQAAQRAGLRLSEEVVAYVLVDLYGKTPTMRFNAFHPGFLIEQCISICNYRGMKPQLTPDVLDLAWENLLAAH